MHYDEREKLNHLIEHLKDGEAGFAAAADGALSPGLKDTLLGYAAQRAEFAESLQLIVEESGEKAEYSGTIGGALHRGWINLKAALAKRTDLAILEECEAAEDIKPRDPLSKSSLATFSRRTTKSNTSATPQWTPGRNIGFRPNPVTA